jgi:hypothetical protein
MAEDEGKTKRLAGKRGLPGENQEKLGKDERERKCAGRRFVTQDYLN